MIPLNRHCPCSASKDLFFQMLVHRHRKLSKLSQTLVPQPLYYAVFTSLGRQTGGKHPEYWGPDPGWRAGSPRSCCTSPPEQERGQDSEYGSPSAMLLSLYNLDRLRFMRPASARKKKFYTKLNYFFFFFFNIKKDNFTVLKCRYLFFFHFERKLFAILPNVECWSYQIRICRRQKFKESPKHYNRKVWVIYTIL